MCPETALVMNRPFFCFFVFVVLLFGVEVTKNNPVFWEIVLGKPLGGSQGVGLGLGILPKAKAFIPVNNSPGCLQTR